MAARARPIRLYGELGGLPAPEWAWVEQRLAVAPLYWVVAATTQWPHPRPVWGVWHDARLCLSVGSPVLRRSIEEDSRVTVHLESATDVVVVEGRAVQDHDVASAVARYDEKYDYAYDVARYGPLLGIAPTTVLAWTAAGLAGRDGFRSAGAWTFPDPPAPT
jgi:hypothetical protein